MILYATDLDRTLIYSGRFIKEFPTDSKIKVVEKLKDKEISYMSEEVIEGLEKLRSEQDLKIVVATTRSCEEYLRINLPIVPDYAIIDNGGTILDKDEKPLDEWDKYIQSQLNMHEATSLILDIEDELESVDYRVKMIDNRYLFFKTKDPELYDDEIASLIDKYNNWTFTRQRNKCYAIPNHFSKQIALRYLWHETNQPCIVASGDSELDLPMLTLADYAVIPKHGDLIQCGYVKSGRVAEGGINSPLYTFDIIEKLLRGQKV